MHLDFTYNLEFSIHWCSTLTHCEYIIVLSSKMLTMQYNIECMLVTEYLQWVDNSSVSLSQLLYAIVLGISMCAPLDFVLAPEVI